MVITYEDASKAVRALYALREAKYEDKHLLGKSPAVYVENFEERQKMYIELKLLWFLHKMFTQCTEILNLTVTKAIITNLEVLSYHRLDFLSVSPKCNTLLLVAEEL